jgi:hypothetical protein
LNNNVYIIFGFYKYWKPLLKSEEEELIELYNEEQLDIFQIATTLKRPPGSITARLKK